MTRTNLQTTVEFNRPAKYKFVKRLGSGACGETVLIYDENMDCRFVAKKYKPIIDKKDNPTFHAELMRRFNSEARILFRINHPNIVRVYSYYDYKEKDTAYIIMEYVDGSNIVDYARENPSMLDVVFEKVVDGFAHLEEMSILHRDIRPQNILINEDGIPKIIDFGFGKALEEERADAEKSITLNWWCETPPEFGQSIYDFQTEVYFVGKLFEQIIEQEGLASFKYMRLVRSMCERRREKRGRSFSEIKGALVTGQFEEIEFSYEEIQAYRDFSASLCSKLASVDEAVTFERDREKIINGLQSIFNASMLEEYIPNSFRVISVFVDCGFKHYNRYEIETRTLKSFLDMFKSLPQDKQGIVLENLLAKLDTVKRTQEKTVLDDDIPF